MSSASLAVEWTLSNSGEDAYWVRLDLDFPRGLSFRKVEMLQVSPRVPPAWVVSCTGWHPHRALWVAWIAGVGGMASMCRALRVTSASQPGGAYQTLIWSEEVGGGVWDIGIGLRKWMAWSVGKQFMLHT